MPKPKSNVEWKYWGETDPLYGVWSLGGKNLRGSNPWNEEEFYSSAEPDLPAICNHWQHYGVEFGSCVEIGCGVGRITRLLRRKFSRVYGIDVSEGMLARARQNCDATFLLTDGETIPLENESVGAAFSLIVFQHFQNQEIGFTYLREIYRVLAPNGTLMLNIPIHKFPAALPRESFRISRGLMQMRADLHRIAIKLPNQRLRRKFGAYMHGTTYDFNRLLAVAAETGFIDLEVRIFTLPATDNDRPLQFLFARKQAATSKASSTL
jgi:SAM-dependent methyltransferase